MAKFDPKSLETLLQHFYDLTSIKACICDADGNELCYYPSRLTAFCEILRGNPTVDEKCRACDEYAFEICRKTKNQYSYTCHAGLRECVSPILFEDNVVGFIMIGQIKNGEMAASLPKGLTEEQKSRLRAAYEGLSEISEAKLDAAFHILDACSGYETLKTHLLGQKNSIDAKIDAYVHKNLTSPISVSELCSEFHLSRHELYAICSKYFGAAPAEYVKKCRLDHACRLLVTTKLPIYEIAIRCGIPDYNYFSKVFKSAFGLSPTAYKRQNANHKKQNFAKKEHGSCRVLFYDYFSFL